MSLQNPLCNQDVLQFVEEAAGRQAFECGKPEGSRAQERYDQEDPLPCEERAGRGGFALGPPIQQKGGTGGEGHACEKERDPLVGLLLRKPRLPGGEDPQAGHDKDSA
jgi:hypothetical protein